LVALSLGLSLAMLVVVRLAARRPNLVSVRLAVALLLFWAFLWLSPQIYYAYFMGIIPGLPAQVVVRAPPGPIELARLLVLQVKPTLAHHGQAALGWLMLVVAAFAGRRR
jgi:hypothetical protein